MSGEPTSTHPQPTTKLSQLLALMATNDWNAALSFASKFQDLGDHKEAITRGHAAVQNPAFYASIKKDPAALRLAGIAALKAPYLNREGK